MPGGKISGGISGGNCHSIIFVATNTHKHVFVATNFVATKMTLVAAPANDKVIVVIVGYVVK